MEKKTFTEIERDATEFRHKFGTEFYTQVSENCYDVECVYTNGLRAYIDGEGLHFTGIYTIWDVKTTEFDVLFVVKSNNAIANWTQQDLEDWAKNGFDGIEAIVVKGNKGSKFYHAITPREDEFHFSRGYATCEECIKDTIFYAQ